MALMYSLLWLYGAYIHYPIVYKNIIINRVTHCDYYKIFHDWRLSLFNEGNYKIICLYNFQWTFLKTKTNSFTFFYNFRKIYQRLRNQKDLHGKCYVKFFIWSCVLTNFIKLRHAITSKNLTKSKKFTFLMTGLASFLVRFF